MCCRLRGSRVTRAGCGAVDGRRLHAYPVAQGGAAGPWGEREERGSGEPGEAPAPGAPRELPAGTVTFLFTDLEGSTRLLEAHPAAYRDAVRRHHALLRGAVEAHGGVVFETVGDAVYAAFAQATDAVAAALAGQLALRREDWGALGEGALRARMGLHTGEVGGAGRALLRRAAVPRRAAAAGGPRGAGGALGGHRRAHRGRPAGRGGPARPGRAPPQGPGEARAGLPARCTPTSRPSSRRCARSTRSRTTCPCSSPASSGGSASWRTCAAARWTRPGC